MLVSVIKCLPGGKEETIADATLDLRRNFGDEFSASTIDMNPTKDSKGSMVKTFLYIADINLID